MQPHTPTSVVLALCSGSIVDPVHKELASGRFQVKVETYANMQGDRFNKVVIGVGAVVALAIEEEGRCTVHAAAHAAKEVVTNLWLKRPIDERL